MAAIGCHVAFVKMVPCNSLGTPVPKDTATIGQRMTSSEEPRIVIDPNIPSSAGNPTIMAYLLAEAALGYKAAVVTNTMIVTYNA